MITKEEASARKVVSEASKQVASARADLDVASISGDLGTAALAARKFWDVDVILRYKQSLLKVVMARL